MVEIFSGAPPVMLGIAALVWTTAWSIDRAGPELRRWVQLRRKQD